MWFFLFERGFGIGLLEVSWVKESNDFLEGVKEKNFPLKAITFAILEIGHEE